MKKPVTTYVVWGECGEYSNASFKIFCATTDKAEALEVMRKGNEESDRAAERVAKLVADLYGNQRDTARHRSDFFTYHVQATPDPGTYEYSDNA